MHPSENSAEVKALKWLQGYQVAGERATNMPATPLEPVEDPVRPRFVK
jgi:hypothetical protein